MTTVKPKRKCEQVYCPTEHMPGVWIGSDFWPTIRWEPGEIRKKWKKGVDTVRFLRETPQP